MKIKAEWVFSVIKALEARLEYSKDNDYNIDEQKTIEGALNYFKNLEIPLSDNMLKQNQKQCENRRNLLVCFIIP